MARDKKGKVPILSALHYHTTAFTLQSTVLLTTHFISVASVTADGQIKYFINNYL